MNRLKRDNAQGSVVVGGRRGREMLTMEKLADANQVRATLHSYMLIVRLYMLCEPGESYTKVYNTIRFGIFHAGHTSVLTLWTFHLSTSPFLSSPFDSSCLPVASHLRLSPSSPHRTAKAGGRQSQGCTLILTEGDSAMSLAVAGLDGIVGEGGKK